MADNPVDIQVQSASELVLRLIPPVRHCTLAPPWSGSVRSRSPTPRVSFREI